MKRAQVADSICVGCSRVRCRCVTRVKCHHVTWLTFFASCPDECLLFRSGKGIYLLLSRAAWILEYCWWATKIN